MMCQSKNKDAVLDRPINDGERKTLEKDLPSALGRSRAGKRKSKRTRRCVFNRRSETRPKTGLLLIVVNDLDEKLTACGRYEPGPFHRDRCRASANTSSAA